MVLPGRLRRRLAYQILVVSDLVAEVSNRINGIMQLQDVHIRWNVRIVSMKRSPHKSRRNDFVNTFNQKTEVEIPDKVASDDILSCGYPLLLIYGDPKSIGQRAASQLSQQAVVFIPIFLEVSDKPTGVTG